MERDEVATTPTDDDKDTTEDDVEDADADEDEPAPTEKVKETVWDWKLLNENKAIWLRPPSEISEEEYTNFYKAVGKVRSTVPSIHHHNTIIFHNYIIPGIR